MGLITIPGNIKQQYLPFVLKPDNPLNGNAENSSVLKAGGQGAQCFSFRRKSYADDYKAGFGLLNICPSTFREAEFGNFLAQDISFRTLFSETEARSITADDIMNSIPGIQIREYLPDTRLDQVFNLFGDILSKAVKMVAGIPKGTVDMIKWVAGGEMQKFLADPDQIDKLKLSLSYVMDWIMCAKTANKNNLLSKDGESRFSLPGNRTGSYNQGDLDDTKILTLPYTLYYRLQSCVTTNVYELPCKIETAFDVHGQEGWGGGILGIENTFINKIPGVGDFLKTMFNNVRINFMNWWDAESGSKTVEPEVTVKFCLFNDTAERAMMNFIFINTIAPNNMWVQYGIFQHSSSVYDIKIEGHKRLFACAGNVKVSYKGVLRNPPPLWVRNLVNKYGNSSGKKHGEVNKSTLAENILKDNLIKIPDIYEVELQFKSMIPQNLNTYLYQFSQNQRIENAYMSGSVYQDSEIAKFNLVRELAMDLEDYNKNHRDKELAEKRKKDKSEE